MPLDLLGVCRCGAVRFRAESRAPCPYQLCYCSICRKTAGGGGFAINLLADAATLRVEGRDAIAVFHAPLRRDAGGCETSRGERRFCRLCATALWVFDPDWPQLIHPFASAIDTDLPRPPERAHILLASKAAWVDLVIGPRDQCFDGYPDQSIEAWHKARGLWLD